MHLSSDEFDPENNSADDGKKIIIMFVVVGLIYFSLHRLGICF